MVVISPDIVTGWLAEWMDDEPGVDGVQVHRRSTAVEVGDALLAFCVARLHCGLHSDGTQPVVGTQSVQGTHQALGGDSHHSINPLAQQAQILAQSTTAVVSNTKMVNGVCVIC